MNGAESVVRRKVVLFANTDWYLYNFRLPLANALREKGYEVVLLSPEGQYGLKLRAMGFRWEVAPMNRRSLNLLKEFSLVIWLVKFLRSEDPDLIHNFTVKCTIYGSIAARLAGIDARINAIAGMGYVFSSSNLKACLLRPLVRALMRVALNGRKAILILQNPDDSALLQRARVIDDSKIRIIKGSGVDCKTFLPASHGVVAELGPLRVLLASRLVWDKGIAEYVDAARQLIGRGVNVKCLLAGAVDNGNPAAIDERLVAEWGASGLITWLGNVEDMRALLQTVDVMVLPSYREGLPKTLIEAAACGLPLITTDVAGCREVVSADGVDGLSIPPRDSVALASAIERLAADRNLAKKLGAAARKKVLDEFSDDVVLRATLGVYEEISKMLFEQLN